MRKKSKILLAVFLIIVALLIINEFVLFPIFPSSIASASCAAEVYLFDPQLGGHYPSLMEAELVLTGIAGEDSRWVTDPATGMIETHSEVTIDDIIAGVYDGEEITVSYIGGCDIRLNLCMSTSVTMSLGSGTKQLLFLSDKNKDGAYSGFSICGGGYRIVLDDEDNEIVSCFAEDLENCEGNVVKLSNVVAQIQNR